MEKYIYQNPYCLSEEQLKNLSPNQPSEIDTLKADFDENGLLKIDCQFRKDIRSSKISLSDDQPTIINNGRIQTSIKQSKKLEERIEALNITRSSKEKLRYFVKYLGHGEKPYSVEEFRRLGHNYLDSFLNPAIDAGIIVKTGTRGKALYKVGN